jgi:hypothetical protein
MVEDAEEKRRDHDDLWTAASSALESSRRSRTRHPVLRRLCAAAAGVARAAIADDR